jgi:beta-phosphoglucomutase-like phosphatase (HAD superfamily)
VPSAPLAEEVGALLGVALLAALGVGLEGLVAPTDAIAVGDAATGVEAFSRSASAATMSSTAVAPTASGTRALEPDRASIGTGSKCR